MYSYPQLSESGENFRIKLSGFADHSLFSYLTTGSSCFKASSIDDLVEFERTVHALRVIGMSVCEIEQLFSVVAAVLHVGNIEFAETDQGEGCCVGSRDSLSMAQALLELPCIDSLETALCTRAISVSSSEGYRALLPASKARDVRDALSRFLYGIIFGYLVGRINEKIGCSSISSFVGILDIFGFEFFPTNTYEQLCINYANERLQQLFVECVLRADQKEYELERINWNRMDFPDNSLIIHLLDQKVFPMLDEECRVIGGSDSNFLSKLIKNNTGNKYLSTVKARPDWFVINHFAGSVCYKVTSGFVEKNRDTLSSDIVEVCKQSLILENLCCGMMDQQERRRRNTSVSSEFRNQLNSLMEIVSLTNPFFIRCIKPNNSNLPDQFDVSVVAEQLRYGGVVQAVQISRAGFPVRLKIDEFASEFKFLGGTLALDSLAPSDAAVGVSKVFLKQKLWDHLCHLRDVHRRKSVVVIQSFVRMRFERFKFISLRNQLVAAQAIIRTALVVREVSRNNAAVKIQAAYISFSVRRYFQHVKSCVLKIQRVVRTKLLKKSARISKRRKSLTRDLAQQMQLLGNELRIAKETMKTVDSHQNCSRLAYFNSGTPNQSYFAPHLSIPPAPFFLSREGGVSSRFRNENVAPTIRSFSKIGSIEKRVQKVHGDMAKMKELIDRIQNNMSDLI